MDSFDDIENPVPISLLFDDEDEFMIGLLAKRSNLESSRRGSLPGRSPNIERNFALGHLLLFEDYFRERPTYNEKHFIRRFRMTKDMFLMIKNDLESHDEYFTLRCNAAGKMGLSPLQKCTAALRMLAYGSSASSLDENIRIGESTTLENLRKFCKAIIAVYGPKFLRIPDAEDVKVLINAERGFPGMVASIDCMHWTWKNCPVALKGQYQGKEGKPSIVLEVFASKSTHIWYAFFGCPGSCNDINVLVLDRSPLIHTGSTQQRMFAVAAKMEAPTDTGDQFVSPPGSCRSVAQKIDCSKSTAQLSIDVARTTLLSSHASDAHRSLPQMR
nr:uncharacterized protein LOC115269898 [Aedes albopictus]